MLGTCYPLFVMLCLQRYFTQVPSYMTQKPAHESVFQIFGTSSNVNTDADVTCIDVKYVCMTSAAVKLLEMAHKLPVLPNFYWGSFVFFWGGG